MNFQILTSNPFRFLLVPVIFLAFSSCGSDDDGDDDMTNFEMSAKVDGVSWEGTVTVDDTSIPQRTVVTGLNSSDQTTLVLSFPRDQGTYSVGTTASATFINSNRQSLLGLQGTVTISTYSTTEVSGTFSFSAEEVSGAADAEITEGTFAAQF